MFRGLGFRCMQRLKDFGFRCLGLGIGGLGVGFRSVGFGRAAKGMPWASDLGDSGFGHRAWV